VNTFKDAMVTMTTTSRLGSEGGIEHSDREMEGKGGMVTKQHKKMPSTRANVGLGGETHLT